MMNFRRGLTAAFLWPLLGVALIEISVTLFTTVSWKLNDSSPHDRERDIARWREDAIPKVIMITTYFAFVGLATYAPNQKFSFGKTLLLLFVIAIPLTALASPLTPQRLKGMDYPEMYFSEFLVLFIPPLIVTTIILSN